MDSLAQLEQTMAEQAQQALETFEQNKGNESDDDGEKSKRLLWKLVMTRKVSMVTIRFSDVCDCVRHLYQDKDKFTLHRDGSIGMRITLCAKCVALNIDANDAMSKMCRPYRKNASKKDEQAELDAMKAEAQNAKKEHWKLALVRRIATIQIRFSDWCKCSKELYEDKEKLTEQNDGSVSVRIKLCQICCTQNTTLNDMVAKFCDGSAQKRK